MVEIIPKSFEEIPAWQRILLYFLIFLLIAIVVGYFVLNNAKRKSEEYLITLEQRISGEITSSTKEFEEEVLGHKNKIRDLSSLLNNHILATKFFEFIEKKTHPDIFFSEVGISLRDSKVNLSGVSKTFLYLGQQISIFKKSDLVKDLQLSEISINKEGEIAFRFDILLKEELFRYSKGVENKQ